MREEWPLMPRRGARLPVAGDPPMVLQKDVEDTA